MKKKVPRIALGALALALLVVPIDQLRALRQLRVPE